MNAPTPPLLDAPDVTIVTGASGWLGAALMHALTSDGPWHRPGRIRVMVRDRVEADRLEGMRDGIHSVVGDLTHEADVNRLFADISGTVDVIHTAGVIHPRSVDQFFAVNIGATRSMLQHAANHDVRRFVHVSSNSPFGTNAHPDDRFRDDEPFNPYYGYGRSKMEAEIAVAKAVAAGLNAVIVRPPWFYGPYQPPRQTTFFKMVRTGLFPVFAGGNQSRSMVYVDNLVQGVVRAELADTPAGRGWWIADARPYTVTEIVDTVGRALTDEGFDVRPNRAKVPGFVAQVAERADALIQRTGRYHQQIHVLGEMNKNIAVDVSGARAELGYDPEVDLYDGMRRSIRWCIDQGLEL